MSTVTRRDGFAAFFWLAFERSKNPMLIMEFNRELLAVNDACERAFGRMPDEVLGRRSDHFVSPEWWRRLERDWAILARDGTVASDLEVVRPEGTHIEVQYSAAREQITGRELVLSVVIDYQARPRAPIEGGGGGLTKRETEVVSRLALGQRVHEIATDLILSPATVQTHQRNAMQKLSARSQAQLVATAMAGGMLEPDVVRTLAARSGRAEETDSSGHGTAGRTESGRLV